MNELIAFLITLNIMWGIAFAWLRNQQRTLFFNQYEIQRKHNLLSRSLWHVISDIGTKVGTDVEEIVKGDIEDDNRRR